VAANEKCDLKKMGDPKPLFVAKCTLGTRKPWRRYRASKAFAEKGHSRAKQRTKNHPDKGPNELLDLGPDCLKVTYLNRQWMREMLQLAIEYLINS